MSAPSPPAIFVKCTLHTLAAEASFSQLAAAARQGVAGSRRRRRTFCASTGLDVQVPLQLPIKPLHRRPFSHFLPPSLSFLFFLPLRCVAEERSKTNLVGMFQPQPTPFASSCFNSFGVPDFSFAPTPLTLQNPSNLSGAPAAASHTRSQAGGGAGSVSGSSKLGGGHGHGNGGSNHSRALLHARGGHGSQARSHQNVHGRVDASRGNSHSHAQLQLPLHTAHTAHTHHQRKHNQHNHLRLHQRQHAAQAHPNPHSRPPQPHPSHPQAQTLLYGSPSHTSSPSASPVASSQGHFSPTHNLPSYNSSAMDQSDAQVQTAHAQALQDELAAQEAAAREYQPQLEVGRGPPFPASDPSKKI